MSQPASSNSSRLRPTAQVNSRLDKSLAAYMAAAGAAGVGMLSAAPAAEAKIVYTATNISIVLGSTPIDLNHDGITDFALNLDRCNSRTQCLHMNPAVTGNGVKGANSEDAAGFFGVPVGPGGKFLTGTGPYSQFMALAGTYVHTFSDGPWANVTNRYLGLRFSIAGQTHYGWARLSVNLLHGPTVLTGYAYETTPNTPIIEGHTHGATASNIAPSNLLAPAQQPANLGMLARGTDGLAIWRRDEEVSTDRRS